MKVGDLVRWKREEKTKPQDDWVGIVVRWEKPSFAHVLWSHKTEPWTWVHRERVEVIGESR